MAVGPTSLSCCLCLAPARTAGGPLLLHPLRLGPPLASLCPLPFFFGPTAALNRSLSARLSLRLPWPLLASGRHNQYSPGCLPIPLSRLHDIHRHLRIPYGAWSGGSTLGSVPPSLPARPVGAHGFSSEGGATPHLVPLRKQLRAIKRLDPKLQLHVLREGLGRPRCQRAQRLLKRGDPQAVSARCPFFLQQLKPRLRLWKNALTVEELPPPLYPEVAFAGRSNAGKSTLLNELCGRSGTAAVSRRPGSTQSLFFFKAGSPCCICLVDLPGYGYAEAEASKRLQWTEMSLFYLKARPNLKRVFLLVDARWGLKASDICLLSFFERHRIPFQLVLTKADLPEQKSLIKILQIASVEMKKFKGCAGPPLAVSALRHRGLDHLRAEIEKLRLSKELVIGRLRLKAANLVEARRLKKEANKLGGGVSSLSTAEHTKTATTPGLAASTATGSPEREAQKQDKQLVQAPDDPVARALERWGTPLSSAASRSLDRILTQEEGGCSGDEPKGSGEAEDLAAEGESPLNRKALELIAVSPQDEAGVDALGGTEFTVEEVSAVRRRTALSSVLAAAVDRAAGALPLPDVSCAETLIRDLLPSSSCTMRHVHKATEPHEEPLAGEVTARYLQEVNTNATPLSAPVSDALHSSSLHVDMRNPRQSAKPANSAWAANVFHEVRLDSSAAAASSASLHCCKRVGVEFEGDCATSLEACVEYAGKSALEAQRPNQNEKHPQQSKKLSLSPAGREDPSGAPARNASKRPLDLLRANDWRARRVGRAAVEIDMCLPRVQDAAGNVATLDLGSWDSEHKRCAPVQHMSQCPPGPLPDLSAVLNAQQQQQQRQRQPTARTHKDTVSRRSPSRPPLGGAVFLDEETLAAEDFSCSATRAKGRIGSAPDPSNYTGAHELDMQRSFDRKWRNELLPVGGSSEASNLGTSKSEEKHGIAGGAQRNKAGQSNPFRIPQDYIGTREDRTKATTKRLALEILLQRAQEAQRSTDSSLGSEERNRNTADSLLFSAAQRRQERRLKDLANKTNRRQGRSKEMSWDVAYRKWARWAKAHPALAREAPRPSAKILKKSVEKLGRHVCRRQEARQ